MITVNCWSLSRGDERGSDPLGSLSSNVVLHRLLQTTQPAVSTIGMAAQMELVSW